MQFRLIFLPFLLLLSSSVSAANADLSNLASLFSQQDAILLKAPDGQTKFEKNPNQLMVPASTVKLVTALLCLEQYGADHQWPTNFVIGENKLLVRGAGDPFLVSEEIDLIAAKLVPEIKSPIEQLIVETTWLKEETLRFRTQVDDPYNAPASAVAANFNSVKLQRLNGSWISAEPQTPLTALAESLADNFHRLKPWVSGETRRVNLQTSDNAHRYFAEVLLAKIKDINPDLVSQTPTIRISQDNAAVDPLATSITYTNSRTLGQIIKAGLQFSNNFIFNQLFLSLNEATSKSFADAQVIAKTRLASSFNWRDFSLVEGAGLSRDNRLSVTQLVDVVSALSVYKKLLPKYEFDGLVPVAYAKTGTLRDVKSMAGFIESPLGTYQFAFIFNRQTSWKYREKILQQLAQTIHLETISAAQN